MGMGTVYRTATTQEAILEYVSRSDYQPLKLKDLARAMDIPQVEYRNFRRLVKDLEGEGILVRLRHSRYATPAQIDQAVGKVYLHPKGYAFVVLDGNAADIFVRKGALKEAGDGDQVRVEIIGQSKWEGSPEGRVIEVIDENFPDLVGTLLRRGQRVLVEIDDGKYQRQVYIDAPVPEEAIEGYKVVVRIVRRQRGAGGLRGEIVEVLGDPAEARLDFLRCVKKMVLPLHFPPQVLAEVESVNIDIQAELAHRRDLRSLCCVTIDPKEAKDFDDALSIESTEGGNWLLGVHIADVSHYVSEGSAVDREAQNRGTSVYLLDQVIPMLPEKLSSDICTLMPGQDRLAVSVMIELDASGRVGQFEVLDSIVCSSARLTYDEVQAVFDERQDGMGAAYPYIDILQKLIEVSRSLESRRKERGALNFDLPSPLVELDAMGEPTGLGRSPRFLSHCLVEECMLIANECVGQMMHQGRQPALYRVHAEPNAQKLKQFADYVGARGFKLDKKPSPADLQKMLGRVAQRRDAALINRLLLRAMMRAEYSSNSVGHYGLASEHYLHFTSPIRRYPDLLVHRLVKEVNAGRMNGGAHAEWKERLPWLGKYLTECERRAEEAERDYIKTKQLRFMKRHLGEEFTGLVSGVLRSGFFVEIARFMVEGFCRLADLEDYYLLDERRQLLIGHYSGRTFRQGTEVTVRIDAVNLAALQMDFVLADEEKQVGRNRHSKPRGKRR